MTAEEAAALLEAFRQDTAEVPDIDPRSFAIAFVKTLRTSESEELECVRELRSVRKLRNGRWGEGASPR